jgi:hypothetical protein
MFYYHGIYHIIDHQISFLCCGIVVLKVSDLGAETCILDVSKVSWTQKKNDDVHNASMIAGVKASTDEWRDWYERWEKG